MAVRFAARKKTFSLLNSNALKIDRVLKHIDFFCKCTVNERELNESIVYLSMVNNTSLNL